MVGDIPLLQATGVAKSYPGVVALDHVDFDLMRGEVHALLGENGAGKSTLVRILTGAEHPDAGEIRIEGDIVDVSTPRKAQENGIAAIYQDVSLELVPQLSVAENVYLGREPRRRPAQIAWPQLHRGAEELLRRLDFDAGFLKQPVGCLTRGEQQIVALAKALSLNTRVLIMDEPTASLNTHETGTLFNTVRALSDGGVGIIYISHRLEELLACAHRVTVLRDGKVVGTVPVAAEAPPDAVSATSAQQSQLVRMMVGHDVAEQYPRVPSKPDTPSLVLEELSAAGGAFSDISLTVHGGETVGIYGIAGCGGRQLIRSLFGLEPIRSGRTIVFDEPKSLRSPKDAISCGIAFIPDDRTTEGLLAERSVRENVTAPILHLLSQFGIIKARREAELTQSSVSDLQIKTPSIDQLVRNLSGGNQQKVVFAKWLSSQARIFLFNEPTRGIDVAAKAEIYRLINRLKSDGAAILVVSSELPEVVGVSDRILVMRRGSIVAEYDPQDSGTTQASVFDVASSG